MHLNTGAHHGGQGRERQVAAVLSLGGRKGKAGGCSPRSWGGGGQAAAVLGLPFPVATLIETTAC